MGQEPEKPDRTHKVILLLVNVVCWLGLSVRLMRRWHGMPSGIEFWGIYLAVIFPVLLSVMLRDKSSLGSLVGVTLAFLGVCALWLYL